MLHTLRYSLAENARRPQGEKKNEHGEGEDVPPLSAEPFAAESLDKPQHEAAQHRPLDVADAADDCGGERLESDDESHQKVDLAVVRAGHHASGPGQRRTDEEGACDHRVDV